jgi:hypothetical protein
MTQAAASRMPYAVAKEIKGLSGSAPERSLRAAQKISSQPAP